MPGIGFSLSRLRKLRDLFEKRLKAASGKSSWRPSARPTRLREITNFDSNPGNLRMHAYVPDGVGPSPPLVVALHGCTQTADSYDQGTGWSHLADRLGFILIFPEQQAANNPKNCFSWFLPGDTCACPPHGKAHTGTEDRQSAGFSPAITSAPIRSLTRVSKADSISLGLLAFRTKMRVPRTCVAFCMMLLSAAALVVRGFRFWDNMASVSAPG